MFAAPPKANATDALATPTLATKVHAKIIISALGHRPAVPLGMIRPIVKILMVAHGLKACGKKLLLPLRKTPASLAIIVLAALTTNQTCIVAASSIVKTMVAFVQTPPELTRLIAPTMEELGRLELGKHWLTSPILILATMDLTRITLGFGCKHTSGVTNCPLLR